MIPTIQEWKIKPGFLRHVRIDFVCPCCGVSLSAEVSEAGASPDSCTVCDGGYILPVDAADEARSLVAANKQAKQEHKTAARRKREEERLAKAEEKRTRELELARQQREEARNQPGEKSCPVCAEVIAFTATKCKHCGEFLDDLQETTIWEGHPSGLYYLKYYIIGVLPIIDSRHVMAEWGILFKVSTEVAVRDIRTINMSLGILERCSSAQRELAAWRFL